MAPGMSRYAVMCLGLLLQQGCATANRAKSQSALSHDLAEVLVAHHAYEQATPLLQRAVAENPADPRVHTMLGIVLRDRGMFAQAEAELREAYRLTPDSVDVMSAMGVLYDSWGQGDAADGWHRRAIRAAPQAPDYYNNLGFSLTLRRRWADSAACFEAALRRDPTYRRAANNLGFARTRLGDYSGAMRSFENAGGRAAAFCNLGLAYELDGDLRAAKSFYQQALQLDKQLTSAQRNLATLMTKERKPQGEK